MSNNENLNNSMDIKGEDLNSYDYKENKLLKIVLILVVIGVANIAFLCFKYATNMNDSTYYLALASTEAVYEPINKYIDIYLTFKNKDIPEEEWKYIEKMTDKSILNFVKDQFTNKADKVKEYESTDEDPYIDPYTREYTERPADDYESYLDDYELEQDRDELIKVYYIFISNTFIAEIVNNEGVYLLCFQLNREGKVCNIYA